MSKKIITIVGARPQFIKASALSRCFQSGSGVEEKLVHTGQHFDDNMSKVFFDELEMRPPAYNLEINGGTHGVMTGRMLESIEKILVDETPDWVLIYGDTNSTLAGALAAAKLHIPVAHVEAGLRSFNMRMPEEINRIVADRLSTLLFCPTTAAIENLHKEGVTTGIHHVGDVMYDVALYYGQRASRHSKILEELHLTKGNFVLATCHRAENTDDCSRLIAIVKALAALCRDVPVVFPVHPRTRHLIAKNGLTAEAAPIRLIEPAAYLDMVALEQAARVICTDSGGVQKEAYFFGVPCVTMRDETEWVELVQSGWNQLAGANTQRICEAVARASAHPAAKPTYYGDGAAAEKIRAILAES